MIDARQLRYFLAVARTLSFTRAAAELSISTSPLSRTIRQLEHQLGGEVFLRGTRSVELTPLGLTLIPYAERVAESIAAVERELAEGKFGAHVLHVGFRSIPIRVLRVLLDDVIGRASPDSVTRVHPMESPAQIEQVGSGRLSFGLTTSRNSEERFGYLEVMRERLALALPDEPRFAAIDEVRPADVAGLRFLLQPGMSVAVPTLRAYLEHADQIEHVHYEIVGGLANLIALGGACCCSAADPEIPWYQYMNMEGVVIKPFPDDVEMTSTYLVWRLDRDNGHDLGPIISAARSRFRRPIII